MAVHAMTSAVDVREVAPDVHLLRLGRTVAAPNAYLVGSGSGWVLVDAGWGGSARKITAAARRRQAPPSPLRPAPIG